MIVDKLSNSYLYEKNDPQLLKAFEFLKQHEKTPFSLGRYDLEGDDLYATVYQYDTVSKDKVAWENHTRYADIQFIRFGKEYIGWANIGEGKPETEYDDKNDVSFYIGIEGTQIPLQAGEFMILYPDDIHKPKCNMETECTVEKVVIKVKL